MSGDDVKLHQTRLYELGYTEVGTADGTFGQMTQSAVMRFQSDHSLQADGIVGRMTWAALWGVDPATAGPTPTRELFTFKEFYSPVDFPKYISWDGKNIWIAGDGNRLYKIDPNTRKQVSKYEFGCSVCFGPCELFAVTMDGTQFWAFQYGNTANNDCNSDEPWKNIGWTLRMIDVATGLTRLLDMSNIAYKFDLTFNSMLLVDGMLWLSEFNTIHIIDLDQSSGNNIVISKTIYPGVVDMNLRFANGKVWAAGDNLIMIDPKTYEILVYPMQAEDVAYDGQYLWGTDSYELAVQSIDLETKGTGNPIYFDDIPNLVAVDGKNLWVTFFYSRKLLIVPIK